MLDPTFNSIGYTHADIFDFLITRELPLRLIVQLISPSMLLL